MTTSLIIVAVSLNLSIIVWLFNVSQQVQQLRCQQLVQMQATEAAVEALTLQVLADSQRLSYTRSSTPNKCY